MRIGRPDSRKSVKAETAAFSQYVVRENEPQLAYLLGTLPNLARWERRSISLVYLDSKPFSQAYIVRTK